MKNIVWLASYPKSGNTWFRMFLANYLANVESSLLFSDITDASIASSAVDFEEQIGLNPFELTPDEVDLYRPELYRVLSDENPRGIQYKKVHDAYIRNEKDIPLFPAEVSRAAVYFVRNPLDVCVSYANYSASNVAKTVNLILNKEASLAGQKCGQLRQILLSWQEHYFSWSKQQQIPVCVVRYEDMKRTPMEAFGRIICFLGLEYNEERLYRAIVNSDFKLLQQMEKEGGFKEKIQKCESFFWKGTIGNYENYLSEEQIQSIINANFEAMLELGYIDTNGKLTL